MQSFTNQTPADRRKQEKLTELLIKAKDHVMSPAEIEAQRKSWVCGQMMLRYPAMTYDEASALFNRVAATHTRVDHVVADIDAILAWMNRLPIPTGGATLMMQGLCKVRAAIAAETPSPVRHVELPQDVINLVIAAREAFDTWSLPDCESKALDKALEAFSSRVPYENQPENDQ